MAASISSNTAKPFVIVNAGMKAPADHGHDTFGGDQMVTLEPTLVSNSALLQALPPVQNLLFFF